MTNKEKLERLLYIVEHIKVFAGSEDTNNIIEAEKIIYSLLDCKIQSDSLCLCGLRKLLTDIEYEFYCGECEHKFKIIKWPREYCLMCKKCNKIA